ncbi:MAG: hypothetical protein AB7F86_18815 [Bdellovibrionales bacterium]
MRLEMVHRRKSLTKFMCRELLYEYVHHRLTVERANDVEAYLAECRESQRELENLNKALRYSEKARDIRISEEMLESLRNFEPIWKKKLRQWTLWGSERGWRALPYFFLVAVVSLGLFITKPWNEGTTVDTLLAEQIRKEPDMIPRPAPPAPAPEPPLPTPTPLLVSNNEPPAAAEQPQTSPPSAPPLVLKPVETKPTPAPIPTPAALPNASLSEEGEGERMGKGWLTRGEMTVSDFHNSWPAIRDKIQALGGKIAGSVELGWLRSPHEAYFHFSLPESNRQELEIFLKTFSPVRFSTDRHPRVMPDGQIRIILTVKDGMNSDESPPEAP